MKKIIDIQENIFAQLNQIAVIKNISVNKLINQILPLGIQALNSSQESFKVQPRKLGLRKEIDPTKFNHLSELSDS